MQSILFDCKGYILKVTNTKKKIVTKKALLCITICYTPGKFRNT